MRTNNTEEIEQVIETTIELLKELLKNILTPGRQSDKLKAITSSVRTIIEQLEILLSYTLTIEGEENDID